MSPWWRYLSKVKPWAPALTQRCRCRWCSPKALKWAPTATKAAHTRGWLCRERPTRPHAELPRGSYARRVAGRLWPSLGADCAAARSAAMAAARLRWRRRPAAMIAAGCAWVWLRALHRPLAVDRRDLSEHDALRRRRRADHVQPVRRPRLPDVPTAAQANRCSRSPFGTPVAQCAIRAHCASPRVAATADLSERPRLNRPQLRAPQRRKHAT
jgi:hypothetical protein